MAKKKNKFKKQVPGNGKKLIETMKKDGLTVRKLATKADCCPSTITGLRMRDDWRQSETIQMSNLTSHNFVLDMLDKPLDGMVPVSVVNELQAEPNEAKTEITSMREEMIKMIAENKLMRDLLDKKKD